jgi:hypothetical protein
MAAAVAKGTPNFSNVVSTMFPSKFINITSKQLAFNLYILLEACFSYIFIEIAKKTHFLGLFWALFFQICQYPSKPSKKSFIWYLFVIQPFKYTRGRSRKRPRANIPSSPSASLEISTEKGSESPNRNNKRPRKTPQLPPFKVYEDEILGLNSPESSAQDEFTPALFGRELSEIQPYFVENSLFDSVSQDNHHESHSNSTQQTSFKDSQ